MLFSSLGDAHLQNNVLGGFEKASVNCVAIFPNFFLFLKTQWVFQRGTILEIAVLFVQWYVLLNKPIKLHSQLFPLVFSSFTTGALTSSECFTSSQLTIRKFNIYRTFLLFLHWDSLFYNSFGRLLAGKVQPPFLPVDSF